MGREAAEEEMETECKQLSGIGLFVPQEVCDAIGVFLPHLQEVLQCAMGASNAFTVGDPRKNLSDEVGYWSWGRWS